MRAVLLWTLQAAFFCRVMGQIVVAIWSPAWLPPMPEWYSGLLPYPVLLPVQIVMLMWMTVISYDNTREAGFFHVSRETTRRRLRAFGVVYLGVMVARYVLRMVVVPEARWFGRTIPIFFHWVLAGYVLVLAAKRSPGVVARSGARVR